VFIFGNCIRFTCEFISAGTVQYMIVMMMKLISYRCASPGCIKCALSKCVQISS